MKDMRFGHLRCFGSVWLVHALNSFRTQKYRVEINVKLRASTRVRATENALLRVQTGIDYAPTKGMTLANMKRAAGTDLGQFLSSNGIAARDIIRVVSIGARDEAGNLNESEEVIKSIVEPVLGGLGLYAVYEAMHVCAPERLQRYREELDQLVALKRSQETIRGRKVSLGLLRCEPAPFSQRAQLGPQHPGWPLAVLVLCCDEGGDLA